MPRGKKTPPEVIYQIMTSWAVTNNFKETARELELPVTTVKSIVDSNKDKPEFVKLRNEKMDEFSVRASEIIQKGLTLLNKRFDRAIASEEDLDLLIDEIFATDKEELTQDEKNRLVNKIRALQLQDIRAITTAIGTLYDKKALADGKPTENTKITFDLPEGVKDYAG
ncbi:MAG: hypothetical protein J6N52_03680 [Clostridia bacterium]|nr:hypothetical protein [Clostridia bacterium]